MHFSKDELYDLTSPNGGKFGCSSLEEAYNFCKSLATSHYENFPVASALLSKKIRKHIFAIYSFSRIADDIADELIDEAEDKRIRALNEMTKLLEVNYFSEDSLDKKKNPVLFALCDTIQKYLLPRTLFIRLINAFKQDVLFSPPEEFDDLLLYCDNSANPIGEIVLRLHNITSESAINFSNSVCTALQLINFWQDISVDRKKGRIYIPKSILTKYNLDRESFFSVSNKRMKRELLNELYDKTQAIMDLGKPILSQIMDFRLRLEIKTIILSGERILKKIRKIGENVLNLKIKLNNFDITYLLIRIIISKV